MKIPTLPQIHELVNAERKALEDTHPDDLPKLSREERFKYSMYMNSYQETAMKYARLLKKVTSFLEEMKSEISSDAKINIPCD